MSYVINGTEVKVGQIWESNSGHHFVVEDVNYTYHGESYPFSFKKLTTAGRTWVRLLVPLRVMPLSLNLEAHEICSRWCKT